MTGDIAYDTIKFFDCTSTAGSTWSGEYYISPASGSGWATTTCTASDTTTVRWNESDTWHVVQEQVNAAAQWEFEHSVPREELLAYEQAAYETGRRLDRLRYTVRENRVDYEAVEKRAAARKAAEEEAEK